MLREEAEIRSRETSIFGVSLGGNWEPIDVQGKAPMLAEYCFNRPET